MRLIEDHGHRLRYCHPWGKPLINDGRRWKPDNTGEAVRMAQDSAKRQFVAVGMANAKVSPEIVAFAQKSSSNRGINNALAQAYCLPGVPILPEQLDADHFALNCLNGTVDLRTGELRPHRPSDYLTHLCPLEYDANAQSDVWFQFLESILPDEDVRTFLQRYFGYSLTGDVREQILAIFWGSGSNGKSTLINAIQETIGKDLFIKVDRKIVVAQRNTGHSTELMDLYGKRLAFATETEDGERLAESHIKDLTGGESIRGRRMREDTWEYRPTAKFILATNHRPEINGTDYAIWRRLRLVPFTERFTRPEDTEGDPARRCDPKLSEKLSSIRPAILAWMVRGCLDWLENGLPTPRAVVAATAEYRTDQDRIAAFLDEVCLRSSSLRIRSGVLYDAYKKWTDDSGETPLTQVMFTRRIKELFEHTRSDGSWFLGLSTRENP